MQIVLVRHGESEANMVNGGGYRMFTGQWDCELTEFGKAQAENLRGNAVFDGAEACYVSDLKRAQQTAAGFWNGAVITDARLRERSLGDFEGKSVEEVRASAAYEKFFTDPQYRNFRHDFNICAPNGENYTHVCNRVRSFLNDVGKQEKIIIVSHMCTIRCIMKEVLGLSEEETLQLNISTCKPIVVETILKY